jgi:hypothetical protein
MAKNITPSISSSQLKSSETKFKQCGSDMLARYQVEVALQKNVLWLTTRQLLALNVIQWQPD